VAGVVVVRLDTRLSLANASAIEDRLLAGVDEWPDTRALVLGLGASTQLDTTSADVLMHLAAELNERHVDLNDDAGPIDGDQGGQLSLGAGTTTRKTRLARCTSTSSPTSG